MCVPSVQNLYLRLLVWNLIYLWHFQRTNCTLYAFTHILFQEAVGHLQQLYGGHVNSLFDPLSSTGCCGSLFDK